jgi:flagellar protein FlgJ
MKPVAAVPGAGGPAGVPAREALTVPPRKTAAAEVRRLSHELEAVFLNQLFQAMRESVPKSGLIEKSSGTEMFESLLDQRLASEAAQRMDHGLGEQLYRQLSRRLAPDSTEAPK